MIEISRPFILRPVATARAGDNHSRARQHEQPRPQPQQHRAHGQRRLVADKMTVAGHHIVNDLSFRFPLLHQLVHLLPHISGNHRV